MSLVAFALRVTTCRVLSESLPVGFAVHDSPQDPVSLLAVPDPQPFAAVYTGDAKGIYDGRDLLAGSSIITLSVQIFLPATFAVNVSGTLLMIDTRRQGADAVLDVLWRAAARGLVAAQSVWGKLWRSVVLLTPETNNSSYLVEHENVRAIAREVMIKCDVLHEPVPGAAPEGVWADLIAAMRSDAGSDGLAALADWIESEIRGPADLPQGERDRIYAGLTDYAARVLSVTNVPPGNINLVNIPIAVEVPAMPDPEAPLVSDA